MGNILNQLNQNEGNDNWNHFQQSNYHMNSNGNFESTKSDYYTYKNGNFFAYGGSTHTDQNNGSEKNYCSAGFSCSF